MKKNKVIALLVAASIISGQAVVVWADPTEAKVQESRLELSAVENRIVEIEERIMALDGEITATQQAIDKNNADIEATNKKIQEAEANIQKLEQEMEEKQRAFDSRIRVMYKSGGQTSYLSIILSSESFSDFIVRLQAVSKLIGLDQQVIKELKDKEQEIVEEKKLLDENKQALVALKRENEARMTAFQARVSEQNALIAEAKAEKAKIVVNLEEEESSLVAFPISVIENASSNDSDIEGAIQTLRSLRGDIVVSTVEEKVVNAIEKGKSILAQREAARKAEEEAKKKAEEEAKKKAEQEANKNNSSSGSSGGAQKPPSNSNVTGNTIINYAYKFLGTPYVWGGTTPSGFDCSGFTSYVYRQFGYNIGRTTYDQIYAGVPVAQSDMKPGDLIFTSAGHVGFYVGNGQMLHAPRTGDVIKVSKVWAFYAARRIIK